MNVKSPVLVLNVERDDPLLTAHRLSGVLKQEYVGTQAAGAIVKGVKTKAAGCVPYW